MPLPCQKYTFKLQVYFQSLEVGGGGIRLFFFFSFSQRQPDLSFYSHKGFSSLCCGFLYWPKWQLGDLFVICLKKTGEPSHFHDQSEEEEEELSSSPALKAAKGKQKTLALSRDGMTILKNPSFIGPN